VARRHIVSAIVIFTGFTLLGSGISVAKPDGAGKAVAAQVPAFADRSVIPASGKQGPPGAAATLKGRWKEGEALFEKWCQSCHGPRGTDKVENPGSDDGTVPPLNPIDPAIAGKSPSAFADNMDRFIQHGSFPDGVKPEIFMPNWGDSWALSQQEIADVEAYVMRLNGVRGAE